MSMMSFFICLLLNMFISQLMMILIPDYYLAMMFSSLIIAFIYPLFAFSTSGRKILSKDFLMNFLANSIFLLMIDIVFFMINGL